MQALWSTWPLQKIVLKLSLLQIQIPALKNWTSSRLKPITTLFTSYFPFHWHPALYTVYWFHLPALCRESCFRTHNHLWRIYWHSPVLVQLNRVGRDERVCQGPGESTLMEMTVLERDSRRVMAHIQPPLCCSPVQTGCPPEPHLAQLNMVLYQKKTLLWPPI